MSRVAGVVAVASACLFLLVQSASGAFPADAPNDPEYAPGEAGPLACLTTGVDDQQHYLYDFMPACSPLATDPEGASGMSVDKAWRDYTAGSGATTIAYVEGGINWHANDVADLANRVFLNAGELPAPTTPDGDPSTLSAKDYADTPDANGNGLVDPEDIIVRFSDHVDDDHNGYVDDISGWDFYNDQNDPATIDSAYDHANNQERQAAAEADNGVMGAGICPRCRVLPVKAGAEALDRTDDLAQAWLYAADMQADVVVSVTADLGYSSFMRETVEHLWDQGVVMVEASNDFDSTDHQGGMWWPHVLPGNGLVSNAHGVPGPLANPLTTTYRARSSYTSWGPHNMFSVATKGGTTSEATPTVGGVMALVLDYGKQAAREHKIDRPLNASEAIQVVRATSSDIDGTPSLGGWTGKPGFDLQYGYGRPNVAKALKAIADGDVPPEAWIDSPQWYAVYDPTDTASVAVDGHVAAPRSSSYTWKLEYAPGAEPADGAFATAASGDGAAARDGHLGDLDLSDVPESFWKAAFTQSQTKTLETAEQYTVTLRIRVTDADGRTGEERRTIAVHHDPTLAPGFPKRIGTGGEAQPQLADLDGRGHQAIVFGDTDGRVHAVDGATGDELPGWPVTTDATEVTKPHAGVDPRHEPVITNVAIGDLDGTGALSVVATSTTGRTYAWNAKGDRRPGWPKVLDVGLSKPDIPRPAKPFTRDPHQGATSPPTLVDLDGDGRLDIVQPAWDGHIHAWHADGTDVPGWPVDVKPPTGAAPLDAGQLVSDHKLDSAPAIADLDGDGKPEVVVRSQYTYTSGAGLQVGGYGTVYAYHADGSVVDGWPARMHGIVEYYGSAQEFITEGTDAPAAADVDGDGKDEIAASPVLAPSYLFNGDGSLRTIYGPLPDATLGLLAGRTAPATLLTQITGGNLPADAPVSFTASGAFGKLGDSTKVSWAQPGSGAATTAASLLVAGAGTGIQNYLRAYDGTTGLPQPGFPRQIQGLDFLGGTAIADITGDGKPDVLAGADSSALHGFTATGAEAADFPKFTGGWMLWAPTVGDVDADGTNDVVVLTREGYLWKWRTPGKASANQEWWTFRHDEHNTGRYGVDARPPGAVRDAVLADGGASVRFTAPGDDWYRGTPDHYRVSIGDAPAIERPATAAAGEEQTLELPAGTGGACVQAVDAAGNLGLATAVGTDAPCAPDPVDPGDGDPGPGDPGGPGDGGAGTPGDGNGGGAGQGDGGTVAPGPDAGGGTPVGPGKAVPGVKKPAVKAPKLSLSVRRLRGGRYAVTVGGADRAKVRQAVFSLAGRKVATDKRAPFTVTLSSRQVKRYKTLKLTVRATLKDGRTAKLAKSVRRR